MADQPVPIQRTTFGMREFADALIRAWRDRFGEKPTKAQCAVIWSQYALETGKGSACWNFNLGNVKHVQGDGYDYVKLSGVWEIVGGKRVVLSPDNPGAWFRAYASLAQGMADHLEFLHKRYGEAWIAVEAGDPGMFARALKARGYYTAPVEDYSRGLTSLHREWMQSSAYDDALAALEAIEAAPTVPPGDLLASRITGTMEAMREQFADPPVVIVKDDEEK